MSLDAKIEAILFFKAEPVSFKKLASMLDTSIEAIETGLSDLETKLEGRGLNLVFKDDDVMMGTSPEASNIIEKITGEELIKDLGKAGLETLTIVLYRGPITRAEIDYIRGVNSTFVLRNLLIRGLVNKKTDPKNGRSFLYSPTIDLLSYLGLSKIEEMPEYVKVKSEIENFNKNKEAEEANQNKPNE